MTAHASPRMRMDDIPDLLTPGLRVYVPGAAGEPLNLLPALARAPERAAGVTFLGVWIPGANRTDYAAVHEAARMETVFLAPEFQASHRAGRVAFRPMGYRRTFDWVAREAAIDLAFLMVAPPDGDALCSTGVAADFGPAIMAGARRVIGIVNPEMPRTRGAHRVPAHLFHTIIDAPAPLLTYDAGGPDPVLEAVAAQVASLIEDGDVLQFGLGKMQGAVLRRVSDRRGLAIHSGMVSDPLIDLIDAGALLDTPGAVTTGTALGGPALYERCAADPRFHFADVSFTHDHSVLRGIANLVAINSAIEVDLLGQANAEMVGGRQISGAGGLNDFLRGAMMAPNGRGIIALASTARGGSVSRIVPNLDPGAPATVARNDVRFIVTEHGVADLAGQDIDTRAERLIAIADPAFREDLTRAWARARATMRA